MQAALPSLSKRASAWRGALSAGIRVCVFLVVANLAASAKPAVYVVVVPVANIFSAPSDTSTVVSQAIYGSNVTLLVAKGEWSKIQSGDRSKGWTPSRFLRLVQIGAGYATAGRFVQVESLFANVYAEPDVTRHKPVVTLSFETRLEIVPPQNASPPPDKRAAPNKAGPAVKGASHDSNSRKADPPSQEGWLQVFLPDKRTAWIQASDVVDPKPRSIAETVELAKRFVGLPYLWGGTTSFGFDAAGFIQMLMRARGHNLPREPNQQAVWSGAATIGRKDLQAGDLLFLGTSARKITHTGMYLGDGEFIHATAQGHPVVQIGRVDEEPWKNLLVSCRRVK